ncbi:outer membrane protein [Microvirga sp. 2MCAF38]|uniref:outer membrane protein n=1 Tax=Microvirga sp. 2MCAF38 TaxID=3232989 RepID=UPI003F97F471
MTGPEGTGSELWAGSKSDTRMGWALGGGVEYAFTANLSAKVEYLYYNLGTATHVIAPEEEFLCGIGKRRIEGSIVRAGVNYRFSTD